MRDFIRPQNTLTRMSPGAKALYLCFLAFVLAGFGTSLWLYYDSLGLTPSAASTYFLGNESDPDATQIVFAKSTRELVEVAHFHLFTMPVLLLVLAHLFLLAHGGNWKVGLVVAAALFTAGHVAAPFLVGVLGGWIMGVSGVGMLLSYTAMALWPVPDLLTPRRDEE